MSISDNIPKIDVIGVPLSAGGCDAGAALGPAALRAAGLLRRLSDLGFEVRDQGDVAPEDAVPLSATGFNRAAEVAGVVRPLAEVTYQSLKSGALPVVLGGDHSVAMGSVSGVARYCHELGKELFVLWLDAHSDFNTPEISPTGNAHGMSAAFLCGEPGMDWLIDSSVKFKVRPDRLSVVGVRWIDPAEQLLLSRRGVRVFDMREVDRRGLVSFMEELIGRVHECSGALHLSFDIDALDPAIAPGVGTPEPGGLGYREAQLIMQMLEESGLMISADLVEINPILDNRNSGAKLMVELVSTLFGRRILDRRPISPARDSLLIARYADRVTPDCGAASGTGASAQVRPGTTARSADKSLS